ncbi:MAG: YlqD family protein [Firmicutes bacterium]|nr:YlqD family protein [Bacillota bacterium]
MSGDEPGRGAERAGGPEGAPGSAKRITINRPVQVRARVTDKLKRQLAAEIQETIRRLDLELQQIEFQARRVADADKSGGQQSQAVRQHLELERQKRLERKGSLVERLKEIAKLEIGSEILQGTAEGPVNVSPGDRWDDISQAAIILEDGIVVDIRCRATPESS